MRMRVVTVGVVLATTAALVLNAGDQEKPQTGQPRASSQPVSPQPAAVPPTARTPAQAEIIKNLLRDGERPTLIVPQEPGAVLGDGLPSSRPVTGTGGQALLVDGTILVERPGRLIFEEDKPKFVFYAEDDEPALRTMELLPNRLLEAMERESQAGTSEFVVSAEVTRYKDRNYLILRKVLRRLRHGNLAP